MPKKDFAAVDEIEGWDDLSDASKQLIISRAPGKPPRGGAASSSVVASSSAAASQPAAAVQGSLVGWLSPSKAVATAAKAPAAVPPPVDDGGGSFAEFVELCDKVAAVGSTLSKSELISTHLDALVQRRTDPFLTARLLMPKKLDNDLRTYSVKDKSLVAHVSNALRCSEAAMAGCLHLRISLPHPAWQLVA